MEVRNVQVTGGSSYIITLPKEWIKNMKIKKNDQLGIEIQSDGTLLITPKTAQEKTYRFKEIDVTEIQKPDYLTRLLIGAYISGYTSVKILSRHRMQTSIRNTIRSFTQIAVGIEVVEEGEKYVIIKDLLDPLEMPLDKILKRMQVIVRGMYEDTLLAIKTKDKNLVKDVIQRDNDVDRLHWLVARQNNIVLQDISLARKMNLTLRLSSTSFLISRIIERIADHVVRIAQNVIKIIEAELNEQTTNLILSAGKLSLGIFEKSMTSFFKKDIKLANETIEPVSKLETICEEINTSALKQKGDIAINVGYVAESIRRIGEYSENISENVINYLVKEEITIIR